MFCRHSGEGRYADVVEFPGFRVALANASLPGMTIEICNELRRRHTSACYVNWLRFRWGKRCRAGVATSTHRYSQCSCFVKALTKKISAALTVSSHGQKLSLHFRRQTLRIVPRTVDTLGSKAVSRPRATTYKSPEWLGLLMGLPSQYLKRRLKRCLD